MFSKKDNFSCVLGINKKVLLGSNILGQAREYGCITHFLQLPLEGHYFQRATVAQWLNRFQISGYQMKDMDTVFPLIPHGLL